jgi:hypothetical protein
MILNNNEANQTTALVYYNSGSVIFVDFEIISIEAVGCWRTDF